MWPKFNKQKYHIIAHPSSSAFIVILTKWITARGLLISSSHEPVVELRCRCVDVETSITSALHERQVTQLSRLRHTLCRRYLPLNTPHICLVSHQHEHGVLLRVLQRFWMPVRHVVEAVSIRHTVHNYQAKAVAIVRLHYFSKSFLSGGIPLRHSYQHKLCI